MSQSPVPAVAKVNALTQALEWIYDKVSATIDGSTASASEADIDQWIQRSCAGAGAVGFVTNLGGVLTLPVAIPVNIGTAATIQLSLAARIVAARGYDVSNPQVKTFAIACMLGAKAAGVLAGAGGGVGAKLAGAAVAAIPGQALIAINKAVGIRLLTKFGQTGVLNFGKMIPVAGALVGGSIDAASTYAVGQAAKLMFPRMLPPPPPPKIASEAEPSPPPLRPRLIVPGISKA